MSREELLTAHSSDEERQKILRLVTLSDILGYCIIARDYKPPTFLNDQIKLTPYGMEKVQNFARKRIPIPEARAICFLEFSWVDLLVDPMATDVRNVQKAISKQIKDRSIIFPFIFGRELYDKAYEKIDSDDRTLDLADTLEFLDGTPQGVFQLHEYVTGPFGLLNSKQLRFYQPQREANLLHCSDTNCHRIHKVQFSTASEAPVNKHRVEAVRVLQRDSEIPSAWASFIAEVFKETVHPARDNVSETLIPLLGDCLTNAEISALTAWLLDNTQGALREICSELNIHGSANNIVDGMDRAQLMQLCLTMSDRDIIQGIDTLVHEGVISVPPTEVRVPPINGDSSFGTFQMSAELGSHGVRIVSDRLNLAPLRLRDLIEKMYRLTDVGDREELEWQLRTATGETLEARLENYLREQEPRAVVKSLVLARKSNAVAACELLGLREGAVESEDFISLVLWKLGFTSSSSGDPHADFWRHHEDMERMARLGPGGPMSPSVEEFRSAAVNYFVALENALDDAISFVIWALIHDHVTDRRPFVFEPERQRAESYRWLQSSVTRKGDTELTYGDKNSLYALCRGFQCIGSELQVIAADRDAYQRASSDFPDWVSQQSLQRFPFSHVIPFLDLTDDSREAIIKNLQEISRMLVSEKVYDARNNWLHGGRKDLDFANVRSALLAVRGAMQLLEDCGFVRITFAATERRSDGLGRSVTTIENARGVSLEVHAPSPFAWLGLPSVYEQVHVMTAACFAAPNNFLRFVSESNSPYAEMWGDYPRRKPRSQRARHALEGVAGGSREQGIPGDTGLSALP
ncbi:hypothetical protein N8I84_17365 [Streptomyces cynarae]|uniref:Uncharacterized protein n=1 Tax=Streptomyces cynarae TaxID=2981134 RepID=A0ABY6E2Y2_9ACTN|nr:hypothetical protein [Streptomyces cynarae]UXY20288.1 hypothetical protein N8I84_17365 [Streptomyces cynarae]